MSSLLVLPDAQFFAAYKGLSAFQLLPRTVLSGTEFHLLELPVIFRMSKVEREIMPFPFLPIYYSNLNNDTTDIKYQLLTFYCCVARNSSMVPNPSQMKPVDTSHLFCSIFLSIFTSFPRCLMCCVSCRFSD